MKKHKMVYTLKDVLLNCKNFPVMLNSFRQLLSRNDMKNKIKTAEAAERRKAAFTLVEVLTVLGIAGLIMALSLNAIKMVRASYTSLTYFAHKHVTDAVGIMYAGAMPDKGRGKLIFKNKSSSTEEELPDSAVITCSDGSGNIFPVLKNDKEWDETDVKYCSSSAGTPSRTAGGAKNLFCKTFASLSNKTGAADCAEGKLFGVDTSGNEPKFDSKFDPDKPNFTLSNGMRIYISAWQKPDGKVSSMYGYRLVGVDINGGGKKPNNFTSVNIGLPADIVTFLVLDNGEVYPLDRAADNYKDSKGNIIQYLIAHVKGYYFYWGDLNNGKKTKHDDLAAECGESGDKCNFAVVQIRNTVAPGPNDIPGAGHVSDIRKAPSIFTYRQAFCAVNQKRDIGYKGYCSDSTGNPRIDTYGSGKPLKQFVMCPPPDAGYESCNVDSENDSCVKHPAFDQCIIETIKPVFRYNL